MNSLIIFLSKTLRRWQVARRKTIVAGNVVQLFPVMSLNAQNVVRLKQTISPRDDKEDKEMEDKRRKARTDCNAGKIPVSEYEAIANEYHDFTVGSTKMTAHKRKLPVALQNILYDHPEVATIALHLDNDNAGKAAALSIEGLLQDKYNISYEPPPRGKDYNDYLMHIRRQQMN
jgi:hypothetical protein